MPQEIVVRSRERGSTELCDNCRSCKAQPGEREILAIVGRAHVWLCADCATKLRDGLLAIPLPPTLERKALDELWAVMFCHEEEMPSDLMQKINIILMGSHRPKS